jgi:antitoxin component HigA of HigAB toxin-antitoxin module
MALFLTDYSLGFLGLRDGRWKFIYELESGRAKLFNLSIDPDETKNLAVAEPGPVEAYRTLLQRWAAAQRGLILHPKSETCVTRIAIPER